MFNLFTNGAKRAAALAKEMAIGSKEKWVGSDYLLLGLIREGHGNGVMILETLGVNLEELERRVRKESPKSSLTEQNDQIEFAPIVSLMTNSAEAVSRVLGKDKAGTEHLILGMLSYEECIPCYILREMGVTYEKFRGKLLKQHQK